MTAALVELAPTTGALKFVGAGHVDNVIVRHNGDVVSLTSTGTPLGLLPDSPPYTQLDFALEPGDRLVLYSDGVTEAQNEEGEEFGEPRLVEVLRASSESSPDTLIDKVIAAIDAFAGAAPQFDDITMLVVSRAKSG